MKNKDVYIIAITILSILLIISFSIIGWLVVVTTDLRDTSQMYENSKNVCVTELKELEKDYVKLLEKTEE